MSSVALLVDMAIFIGAIFAIMYFINSWKLNRETYDKKNKRNKIIVEIWGTDGFPHKHLVPIDDVGDVVTVNNFTYFLPEDKKIENSPNDGNREHTFYPARRFDSYPEKGMGTKKILRIVSYAEGNPEPIRPFYGRFVKVGKGEDGKTKLLKCEPATEGAIFLDSQLMVTAGEVNARIRGIYAYVLAKKVQEDEARQKTFEKLLANIPSKGLIFIGFSVLAIIGIINIFVTNGNASALFKALGG